MLGGAAQGSASLLSGKLCACPQVSVLSPGFQVALGLEPGTLEMFLTPQGLFLPRGELWQRLQQAHICSELLFSRGLWRAGEWGGE